MSQIVKKEYKFKLIYLEDRGTTDLIKLIFKFASKTYDDVQIKHSEVNLYKKFMLFESLPVLILNESLSGDEIRLSQTNTICRFLGSYFNLNGQNEIEAYFCDMISKYKNLKEFNIISNLIKNS